MNKPSGLASKLRALLKAKEAPMWGVIIVLVIVIIFQQIQISELQWRVDEDHDGSTIDSVAGRLYILEGMANKHSDQLDEILKDIRQLQNDGAKTITMVASRTQSTTTRGKPTPIQIHRSKPRYESWESA